MLDPAYHYFKSYITGQILYMIFYVTPECNSRCRMCYSWKGMQERKKGPKYLDLGEIEKMTSMSPEIAQVSFSGGEPFLRKDLPEICRLFYRNTKTRFFSIPTNCLLPDRFEGIVSSFFEKCPRAYLNFCLPIDGVGALHDDIRGVKGNFEKLVRSARLLQGLQKKYPHMNFVFGTVISRYNYERVREIVDFTSENFPSVPHGFNLVRGDTKEDGSKDFPVEAYREACEYLQEKDASRPVRWSPYPMVIKGILREIQRLVLKAAGTGSGAYRCRAGERLVVVYDNGAVAPCELLGYRLGAKEGDDNPAVLGNLRENGYDLRAILSSARARRMLETISASSCSCTWECAVSNSIISSPFSLIKVLGKGAYSGILPGRCEKR